MADGGDRGTDPDVGTATDADVSPAPSPALSSPFSAVLLLLIAVGAMAGTLARYGLSRALPTGSGRFSVSTFAVNLTGAFVLGVVIEALTRLGPETEARRRVRLLLGTGFCGALTTYSTLAVETDQLVRHSALALAVAYAVATVLAGLVTCGVGVAVAARLRGRG